MFETRSMLSLSSLQAIKYRLCLFFGFQFLLVTYTGLFRNKIIQTVCFFLFSKPLKSKLLISSKNLSDNLAT